MHLVQRKDVPVNDYSRYVKLLQGVWQSFFQALRPLPTGDSRAFSSAVTTAGTTTI